MQNSTQKLLQNLQPRETNKQLTPIKKGQNPKDYVMQNFQELKFVDTLYCSQRGSLRLYRFHPFSKYMSSKLVCSVPSSSLPQGHAQQLLKQYQERCKIKQPHIIYSIASESQNIVKNTQVGQMKLFQIYLFFEFNQFTLDQLAQKRSEKKSLLPEAEAWCLVKGVISALFYLQQKGISHGMISTQNVYFDEEYLLYRVYDQELMNGRWGNWIKCQQFRRGKSNKIFTKSDYEDAIQYLAPECLNFIDLEVQLMEEKVDPYKADIYSFGYDNVYNIFHRITLINALILRQNFSIEKGLSWIGRYYSEELIFIIKMCLQKQPQMRPDWVQLQDSVNLVPENIQNKNLPPSSTSSQKQSGRQSTVKLDETMQSSQTNSEDSQFMQDSFHNQTSNSIMSQRNQESDVELKLQQLNKKIQETLMKSFSKSKILG